MNRIAIGKSSWDNLMFLYFFNELGAQENKRMLENSLSRTGSQGRKIHLLNYDFRGFLSFDVYENVCTETEEGCYCYGYALYAYDRFD